MLDKVSGTIEKFDEYQGRQIDKLSLTNTHGVSVSVLTLGSTLYELNVPDETGKPKNLVLNYKHSQDYLENPFYVCMAIGRVAGRIADGQLVLGGQTTQLPQNEGSTTLHGGPQGFNSYIWEGQLAQVDGQDVIVMHHVQHGIEDGFPGDLDTRITYSLSNDDVVSIKFDVKASADTVFNPTQHTYFNLSHADTIKDHHLKLNAAQALVLDDKKIPTEKRLDVAGTPFDFRSTKRLGDGIDQMAETTEKGFDDVFSVQPDEHNLIAELSDPASHTSVQIESSRNGMIMFTANSFTKDHMNFIRTNGTGHPYLGVALEPMLLPKPGEERDFSEMKVEKGQEKAYTIKYHLHY